MLRSPIGRRPPTCYPPAMDRADAAGRLAELREAIRHHDYAYYVEARPEVADSEYDALRRELSDLEAAFPELITPDSPTQRVAGQPVDTFRPVEHKVAMLSLDNATTPEDLREFEARLNRALPGTGFRYVCEPKIDGLGVALLYQDGTPAARHLPLPRERSPRARLHDVRRDAGGAARGRLQGQSPDGAVPHARRRRHVL